MSRKKERVDTSVILFDVFYEDGSRASNRKIPAVVIGGFDGEAAAKTFIMDQDRKIAEMSGKAPREISRLARSAR